MKTQQFLVSKFTLVLFCVQFLGATGGRGRFAAGTTAELAKAAKPTTTKDRANFDIVEKYRGCMEQHLGELYGNFWEKLGYIYPDHIAEPELWDPDFD